jgi:hypothetical protein
MGSISRGEIEVPDSEYAQNHDWRGTHISEGAIASSPMIFDYKSV